MFKKKETPVDVEVAPQEAPQAPQAPVQSGRAAPPASFHPGTIFFHYLFRSAALAFYILSSLFTDSFIMIFVVSVILLAVDFWVVKNVSGRKLVGLRWWNNVNETTGKSEWLFECLESAPSDQQEGQRTVSKKDKSAFWTALVAFPIGWALMGVFAVFRLKISYLLIIFIALTLGGANIWGYFKCSRDAQKQMSDAASGMMMKGMMMGFGRKK